MSYSKWIRCAVAAGLLAGWTAACDFVEPTSSDPNAVPNATLDQLFVSAQINAWYMNEGNLSWLSSIWTQQMAGTDRQMQDFDNYLGINETVATDEWCRPYGNCNGRNGGGLQDIRLAYSKADEEGRTAYKGILQIHEAFLIGFAASVWGDVPYSQAANPEFNTPEIDDQAAVYAAVQTLLDEAITNLQGEVGAGPGVNDMIHGGDFAAWEATAYSLKARFHMHWAELEGNARYQDAINAAQNGIDAASGDWVGVHSTSATESNLWSQFMVTRSGYISSNSNMVELLDINSDSLYTAGVDDPRLPVYFTEGVAGGPVEGLYVGSPQGIPAGDPGTGASQLNAQAQGDFGLPVLTCYETQFIIAEAENALGNDGPAQAALTAAIACVEDFYAGQGYVFDLDPFVNTSLTGAALATEISTQKYIAMFLNPEMWNDYKRTCTPAITPAAGFTEIPGRLYYSNDERETNPNFPSPGDQGPIPGTRNDNDPNAC